MRVFRTSYKDRDGQRVQASKWYIELRDHLQTVRRFPAFTDKTQSEVLCRQIERLVSCKVAGEQPTPEITRWLEGTPQSLRKRFAEIGLLDAERASGGKPLTEHLTDFQASLSAKGNTPSYVELTTSRIGKVFEGCGFVYLSDISASRIQQYLANLHNNGAGISRQSFNYYLQAVKQFCKWLVQDRRASESSVQHLKV